MEEYKGPERRKYPRVDANFIVSYRLANIDDDYDLSSSKNISCGGMLLTTNCAFVKGTKLFMKIKFPFISERIEAIGDVVDSKEKQRGLIYETRIKFLSFSKDILAEITNFVQRKLQA